MLPFCMSCLNFLDISAIVDGFGTLVIVFEWFHLQKAALQIHRFSINLGVALKTVRAFSI